MKFWWVKLGRLGLGHRGLGHLEVSTRTGSSLQTDLLGCAEIKTSDGCDFPSTKTATSFGQ